MCLLKRYKCAPELCSLLCCYLGGAHHRIPPPVGPLGPHTIRGLIARCEGVARGVNKNTHCKPFVSKLWLPAPTSRSNGNGLTQTPHDTNGVLQA